MASPGRVPARRSSLPHPTRFSANSHLCQDLVNAFRSRVSAVKTRGPLIHGNLSHHAALQAVAQPG
jgi:hypothetical protein